MKIGLWSSATRQPPALYDLETKREIATVKTDAIGEMIVEAVNGPEQTDIPAHRLSVRGLPERVEDCLCGVKEDTDFGRFVGCVLRKPDKYGARQCISSPVDPKEVMDWRPPPDCPLRNGPQHRGAK